MTGPAPAPAPWSGSTWLKGAAVAGGLVACDAWVKVTARVAGCPTTSSLKEALGRAWHVPEGCSDADFFGFARLSPVLREGGPFGVGGSMLGGSVGGIWAIGLLAVAALVSILVLRWRWRSPGDAAALGALWGAVVIEAGPRLVSGGAGTAELQLGGMATGLGDIALVWAAAWLLWRAIAEARA
ncbi:MAG: hypothetical protein H6712_20540 [Myxococcales bacterium]|nr:hypothetical protein [Myxococcales bacterium]MCB9716267.1 hypothetical protein [Myxococcales bacterium]